MAVCNYKYEFTLVDVGDSGRESDGSVFAAINMGNALAENSLSIPKSCKLKNDNGDFPYVIVGDEAFPLKQYLLKPYARSSLNDKRRIFNYRLSRAKRENAFGILASRFRLFRRPINNIPENV